jgi:hypothetical protein
VLIWSVELTFFTLVATSEYIRIYPLLYSPSHSGLPGFKVPSEHGNQSTDAYRTRYDLQFTHYTL